MYRFLLCGAACAFLATPAFAQAIESVTVTAERLDAARAAIQTQTGASSYTVTAADISNPPGGDNLTPTLVVIKITGRAAYVKV